jgi:hypothetical protein
MFFVRISYLAAVPRNYIQVPVEVIVFHALSRHTVRGTRIIVRRQLNFPATVTNFLTESGNKPDEVLAKCNELDFTRWQRDYWLIQVNLITSSSANFIFHLIFIALHKIK